MPFRLTFTLFIIIFGCTLTYAQVQIQRPPEKTRLLFLLDASGSMFAEWEGEMRMDVAKRMLIDLVDSLRADPNLELALRVYGHQYHRRFKNCQDTQLEVAFAAQNHNQIIGKLRTLQPSGVTPIAYSLEQAANDFKVDPDYRNVVIILTDGIESCDGDPCAVSLALQQQRIFLKPFVIGLGMEKDFAEAFACVGQYYDARNVNEFRQVLNDILRQSLATATVSVELLDEHRQPTETDVNVTFFNNFTRTPIYDFVHYRDAQGRPDSVTVDPVLSYDVVANTIPPVAKRGVVLEGGQHHVIEIQAPQGTLALQQPGHSEYAGGVRALVRRAGQSDVINVHEVPAPERYLGGTYDLEVLTFPKTHYEGVAVEPRQTTELNVPGPGVLNVDFVREGIGSLYQLDERGFQRWVHDFAEGETRVARAIQPGQYKLVFRARDAFGSKFTEVKTFTVETGQTVTLKFASR